MSFSAFKEWHVIVEALGAGEQIVILRKGGIAEGHLGFEIEATRFWLFPTRFHAQLEKTKPAATRWFTPIQSPASAAAPAPSPPSAALTPTVPLRYYADIVNVAFLSDWAAVNRLDFAHLWTAQTVRERFDYGQPAGLHALVVRVHRLRTPIEVATTPAMAGCKSWIDLSDDPLAHPSDPVLSDPIFSARAAELSL